MRRPASWVVIALAIGAAAPAAPAHGAASRHELRGTVGPYRIGAAVVCDDGQVFSAAHYF